MEWPLMVVDATVVDIELTVYEEGMLLTVLTLRRDDRPMDAYAMAAAGWVGHCCCVDDELHVTPVSLR
jgi:hypothetical protein